VNGRRRSRRRPVSREHRRRRLTGEDEDEDEEWDEDALDALFNETVRYSLVNSSASAITELHAWGQLQASADDKDPPLRGSKLNTGSRQRPSRRGQDSAGQLHRLGLIHHYRRLRRPRAQERHCLVLGDGLEDALVDRVVPTDSRRTSTRFAPLRPPSYDIKGGLTYLLLGYATVTRGESKRDVELADLIMIDLENEGPRPEDLAPRVIMTMRQGKRNQHGKIEYMGCIQNIDPVICPLSALAFYLFYCWS
jgi:hypothetical protein